MKSAKLAGDAAFETRVVILDSGEEAFAALTRFANDAKLTAASLTAIGAFERATIGWFDFEKKTYKKIEVGEQCEVLSAIGDVAIGDDGKASLHVHVVLGLSDGRVAAIFSQARFALRSRWCWSTHLPICDGKRSPTSALL